MRQDVFVKDLSNVTRFLDGVATLERRGAREAAILLVVGKNGYGKSDTVNWYAAQNPSVHITAKAAYTPGWMMNDFAMSMGIKSSHRTEDTFNAVVTELVKAHNRHSDFHLIVDEVNETTHDRRLLETIRQLSDFSGVPIILAGHKGVETVLKRFSAVYSRICKIVEFAPLSQDDVARLATALLPDVKLHGDMVARIQKATQGEARAIKNALAMVEAWAKKTRQPQVTAEAYGNRPLLGDDNRRAETA